MFGKTVQQTKQEAFEAIQVAREYLMVLPDDPAQRGQLFKRVAFLAWQAVEMGIEEAGVLEATAEAARTLEPVAVTEARAAIVNYLAAA